MMQVISREYMPWTASSEMMFVYFVLVHGLLLGSYDNIHDIINWQLKLCTKGSRTITATALRCIMCSTKIAPERSNVKQIQEPDYRSQFRGPDPRLSRTRLLPAGLKCSKRRSHVNSQHIEEPASSARWRTSRCRATMPVCPSITSCLRSGQR